MTDIKYDEWLKEQEFENAFCEDCKCEDCDKCQDDTITDEDEE